MESCDEYYPVTCAGGVVSYETCDQGLIGCDKKTGKCPAFFRDGSTKSDDMISGGVMLFLALFILILWLCVDISLTPQNKPVILSLTLKISPPVNASCLVIKIDCWELYRCSTGSFEDPRVLPDSDDNSV